MPRKATNTKAKAKTKAKTGMLALARAAGAKALKKPSSEWKVEVNHAELKESLPHIPTGSIVIDYLIGGELNRHGVMPCPGIPRQKITQIWGQESAGKTTLALTTVATCIANGGKVLYVDWEHALVLDYAEALGVPVTDDTKFELVQPDTLEDGIKLAMIYAVAGVDLIVFDSIGAAVTARVANRDFADVAEQAKVGELQAIWSQELPRLRAAVVKKKSAIIGISQIRAIIGGMGHGPKTKPQGGNAWKFFADVRLELRRYRQDKTKQHNALTHKVEERVTGAVIRCTVMKCKLAPSAGRQELFHIRWGEGIDDRRSVMEIAIAHGLIKKGGSWLSWEGPSGTVKKQGIAPFRQHLIDNPTDFDALYNAVLPFLGSKEFAEEEMEDLGDIGAVEDVADLLAEVEGMVGSGHQPEPAKGSDADAQE